jgi:hypothetical protein
LPQATNDINRLAINTAAWPTEPVAFPYAGSSSALLNPLPSTSTAKPPQVPHRNTELLKFFLHTMN